MANDIRLSIRVTREFSDKLDKWATRLGLNKSQLGSMALQAGLSSIIRSIAPEEAMTPEQWASMAMAMEKMGYKLEVPGEKDKAG